MKFIKSGIAIAAMALLAPMAQAAAFTDGGFEVSSITDPFATFNLGSNLGAWKVTSGSVDLIYSYWAPSEGHYSLDLNGNEAGSISQTIDTVIGRTYTVSFDLAGNPAGGGEVKYLTAGAVGGKFFEFDTTNQSLQNMGWAHESFSFVAKKTSTTLSFSGFQGNEAYGAALDNVSVSSVPEPETYGMLLAGLGLVGAIARRKKAAK